MRLRQRWVWLTAQVLGVASVLAMLVAPTYAAVDLGGELRFSLGQVLMVVAVGIAWGDMRRSVATLKEDVKRLRDDIEGKGGN